jgi:hypothetical protein
MSKLLIRRTEELREKFCVEEKYPERIFEHKFDFMDSATKKYIEFLERYAIHLEVLNDMLQREVSDLKEEEEIIDPEVEYAAPPEYGR